MTGRDLRHLSALKSSSSSPQNGDGKCSPASRRPHLHPAVPSENNDGRGESEALRGLDPTRKDARVESAGTINDAEIFEAADDGRLVDLAMHRAMMGRGGRPALSVVADDESIDEIARERALEQVAEVFGRIAEAESALSWLAGFFGDRTLGSAAINVTGIKLGEVREQLPVLRQAVRDIEVDR